MGLLGRQLNLERESEDSLLLALSTLTFTTSLLAGYQESGIGQIISLPLFGIEFHLISTPVWIILDTLSALFAAIISQDLDARCLVNWDILANCFGTTLLFVMFDQGYVWFVASLILLLLAIFIMYWMVLEIYALRHNIIREVPEASSLSLSDWLLSVPSFFISTFISYYYYSKLYLQEDGWFTFWFCFRRVSFISVFDVLFSYVHFIHSTESPWRLSGI